jgi:hypothetical protein
MKDVTKIFSQYMTLITIRILHDYARNITANVHADTMQVAWFPNKHMMQDEFAYRIHILDS